jgi:hypothetical protein
MSRKLKLWLFGVCLMAASALAAWVFLARPQPDLDLEPISPVAVWEQLSSHVGDEVTVSGRVDRAEGSVLDFMVFGQQDARFVRCELSEPADVRPVRWEEVTGTVRGREGDVITVDGARVVRK